MQQRIPRREFLRQASTASAIAGATLTLPHRSIAAKSVDDRVVVGVMGLSRGKSLARTFALQENVHVKYLCDVDRSRTESGCAELAELTDQPLRGLNDFRRILDDDEVDALVCAAPNHWHAPATILACDAGKHVYVEKPCSHNPHEGEQMVKAARRFDRSVQMGTQRRSSLGTRQAMQRLTDGEIGRVYLAKSWYFNQRGSIGQGKPTAVPEQLDYDLWQGPAPRRPYVDNLVHYNWHWRWHWGNGELGNNGVHTIDLCRWGLEVDYPVHVTSSGGRFHYHDDQETPDTHFVCFRFPGDKAITWEGHSCNKHGDGFVTFFGTQGSLDLDSNGNHRVYDASDQLVAETKESELGEALHVANFLQSIRSDDRGSLHAEIEEGYKSTLLCHLGNIAQRTGRALKCSEQDGHVIDDSEAASLWRRTYEAGWEPIV